MLLFNRRLLRIESTLTSHEFADEKGTKSGISAHFDILVAFILRSSSTDCRRRHNDKRSRVCQNFAQGTLNVQKRNKV